MSKKPAKTKKAAKVAKPAKAVIGHNSNGEVIPGMVDIVAELMHISEQKKSLGVAERTLRNRAKTEFGILSGALAHEMRLRKMDGDARVQFESAHDDLKKALGYQPELDFAGATPTKASLNAQPSEDELSRYGQDDKDPEPEHDSQEDDEAEEAPKHNHGKIDREG